MIALKGSEIRKRAFCMRVLHDVVLTVDGRQEPRAKPVRMVYFPPETGMDHVRKR